VDSHNLFLTPTTYRALRLEYAAALAVAVVLLLLHIHQVNWPAFIALFAYIDVIGYIPGAIAWRRHHGQLTTRTYHILYNVTHNFLTTAVVATAVSIIWGPQWALLALPIHLCGDRALFGNFLKPFGISFEPVAHPAYEEFVQRYDTGHDDHAAHAAQPAQQAPRAA
jgi:hypothetical protein